MGKVIDEWSKGITVQKLDQTIKLARTNIKRDCLDLQMILHSVFA